MANRAVDPCAGCSYDHAVRNLTTICYMSRAEPALVANIRCRELCQIDKCEPLSTRFTPFVPRGSPISTCSGVIAILSIMWKKTLCSSHQLSCKYTHCRSFCGFGNVGGKIVQHGLKVDNIAVI